MEYNRGHNRKSSIMLNKKSALGAEKYRQQRTEHSEASKVTNATHAANSSLVNLDQKHCKQGCGTHMSGTNKH